MSAIPDSTLADCQRLIADLQRQLAECRAERDEPLAQQTATAEVLQVINSSSGDLSPVFGAILEKAHTLCGAEFGSLFLYDGEHFRATASHGVPEALVSRLRGGIGANDSRANQQLIAGEPRTSMTRRWKSMRCTEVWIWSAATAPCCPSRCGRATFHSE